MIYTLNNTCNDINLCCISFCRIGEPECTGTRLFLNCTDEGLNRAIDFVSQYDGVRDTVEVSQLLKVPVHVMQN